MNRVNTSEARLKGLRWGALDVLPVNLEVPLQAVLDGQPAERVLDRLLRRNRLLTAEQRAVCVEALFGVGLWRRRLQHRGARRPLELLACLVEEAGSADFKFESWRERFSFPDWVANHLEARFGDEVELAADAFNLPGPVCLRSRGSRVDLQRRLFERDIETVPGAWASHSLIVTSPRPNLYGLGPAFLGDFEVQDEGSQLLGQLVDPQPGDEIIDLCAGAGGKSLQLAALVGSAGLVHATDIDTARLERLRVRAAQAQARIAIHGAQLPAELKVNKILVDAPCSELGTLRRGPDLRWRLESTLPHRCAQTQKSLISTALRHLKPGGLLVYATCTLTREENEDIVDWALTEYPQLQLTKPELPQQLLDDRGCLVLAPHRHGTDGFFGAAFRSAE